MRISEILTTMDNPAPTPSPETEPATKMAQNDPPAPQTPADMISQKLKSLDKLEQSNNASMSKPGSTFFSDLNKKPK